jgi:hypothetical protein
MEELMDGSPGLQGQLFVPQVDRGLESSSSKVSSAVI